MKTDQKIVVVLGMHRSGTSMTAGILRELGVFIGERLFPPQGSNPLGHFEDMDFLELNEEILKAAGGNSVTVPEADAILAQGGYYNKQIRQLIEDRNHDIWGWKDPRTCLTIELFFPFLDNPYFIVCHRDIHSVARSLKKRSNYTFRKSKKLKKIYDRRIKSFFQNHPGLKRLDLEYAEVLASPETHVQRIIEFLEIHVAQEQFREALAMIRPKDQLLEIAEAMNETGNQARPGAPSPTGTPGY